MTNQDWVLQIIASPGTNGRPVGATHLMKTAFLIGAKCALPDYYHFDKGTYGPTCMQVFDDNQKLIELELVGEGKEMSRFSRVRPAIYWATKAGWDQAAKAREENPDLKAVFGYVSKITEWAEALNMVQLVQSIYKAYPEFKNSSFLIK